MLCVAVLAACGSSAGMVSRKDTEGCVRSPARFLPSIAPDSGATLTVRVGAVVYVELVESEKYLSRSAGTKPPPREFPWAAARSSDAGILKRVALCPGREVSTLPIVAYAFRALRPGMATLTAPIAPAWKRVKPLRRHGLRPYRASMIVV
jgi:hypothetical protein